MDNHLVNKLDWRSCFCLITILKKKLPSSSYSTHPYAIQFQSQKKTQGHAIFCFIGFVSFALLVK
jgi:hypothetical protein